MKMIVKIWLLSGICFLHAQGLVEWTPEKRQWEAQQIELWKQKFAESEKMIPSEKMQHLELGLRNMGHRLKMNDHNPDVDNIYQKIQSEFLAIPGHAEHYRDKIESFTIPYLKAQERWEKDNTLVSDENGNPLGLLMNDLIRERAYALSILQELPSAETLAVLGEMLNDERLKVELLPDKSNWELVVGLRPTSDLSSLTLREMIENPPTTGDFVYERDMPVWQNWYRQVKEGRRTVRFKGNPQEYSLTGPVREAKNPDLPRATKRPGPAPQEQASDKPPTTPPSRTPWIAAVLAVIVSLTGWLFLKKRKTI